MTNTYGCQRSFPCTRKILCYPNSPHSDFFYPIYSSTVIVSLHSLLHSLCIIFININSHMSLLLVWQEILTVLLIDILVLKLFRLRLSYEVYRSFNPATLNQKIRWLVYREKLKKLASVSFWDV